jgi:hypothetical protein
MNRCGWNSITHVSTTGHCPTIIRWLLARPPPHRSRILQYQPFGTCWSPIISLGTVVRCCRMQDVHRHNHNNRCNIRRNINPYGNTALDSSYDRRHVGQQQFPSTTTATFTTNVELTTTTASSSSSNRANVSNSPAVSSSSDHQQQQQHNTTTPAVVVQTVTTPKRKKLSQMIPRYVRLKFCDSYADIESDDEMDYATYQPELDPDIVHYQSDIQRDDHNYDFTQEELDGYDTEAFKTMFDEFVAKKRSRSTPSVKRAHHAWWKRTKQEQIQLANRIQQGDNTNNFRTTNDYRAVLDEYASDDGTGIDYYSYQSEFTIPAMREWAIKNYAIPSDQEQPLSLVPTKEITDRTYNLFRLEYYDAWHTKTWKKLVDVRDVMYYVRAERAIPLFVPQEYHGHVDKEREDEEWKK